MSFYQLSESHLRIYGMHPQARSNIIAYVRTKSDGQVPLDAHPATKLYSRYVVIFMSGTVPNVVNMSVDKKIEACFALTKAMLLAARSNFCSIAALTSDAVDAAWAWLCAASWLDTWVSTCQQKNQTSRRHESHDEWKYKCRRC